MSHVLRRPFIVDDPNNLHNGGSIFVSRLATPKPGVIAMQGRPPGSRGTIPRTWQASEFDIANLLYTYTAGYRGMLHIFPVDGDIWGPLRAKIDKEAHK